MAKYKVFHEAEFCNSDHDDLLWQGNDRKEMEAFVSAWAERKAENMTDRNGPLFEQAKCIARSQLSIVKDEPSIVREGGKTIESIKLKKGDFADVSLGIAAMRAVAISQGIDPATLGFSIYECDEDFEVRKVSLSCNFKEYSDGREERSNYYIALSGY